MSGSGCVYSRSIVYLTSCVELLPLCGINNLVVVPSTLRSVWTTTTFHFKHSNLQHVVIAI